MYGDQSGATVGAELLYVVFVHVVPLDSGHLEAVLRGRVWVGDAARHRADSDVAQRHAAMTCGLGHLRARFGATAGSQDSGSMCPPARKWDNDVKTYLTSLIAHLCSTLLFSNVLFRSQVYSKCSIALIVSCYCRCTQKDNMSSKNSKKRRQMRR